ncbi:hypothetical protein E2C01_045854 [Portunus trituberculatus]|uniref:Uncharacterized protein n=1 Tax=Portunus trituberculatus TaxID=210409 RepID=A0A5B7G2I0_PORTR|nr:hypothetical protein [Portunus trituberculatus]
MVPRPALEQFTPHGSPHTAGKTRTVLQKGKPYGVWRRHNTVRHCIHSGTRGNLRPGLAAQQEFRVCKERRQEDRTEGGRCDPLVLSFIAAQLIESTQCLMVAGEMCKSGRL